MSSLAKLQQELSAKEDDLDACNTMLHAHPNDSEILELKTLTEELIADLKAQIAAVAPRKSHDHDPPPPPPAPPKYDMSKHPKFRQQSPSVPPPPPEDTRTAVFNTGDSILAKYSGDKAWYQATIISKTGSSADPVYTVTFVGYNDKETKRKHEVRAIESKKRKAEAPPPPPGATAGPASAMAASPALSMTTPSPMHAAPLPPPPSSVISAAPSVDQSLVQKREPSKVSDGPSRMAPEPKKLKGNKALDKAKSSWNDWQKNGPKKPAPGMGKKLGKDSQFRTPDLPNAKVGFTGSGKPMQKDPTRAKWNYGHVNDGEPDFD